MKSIGQRNIRFFFSPSGNFRAENLLDIKIVHPTVNETEYRAKCPVCGFDNIIFTYERDMEICEHFVFMHSEIFIFPIRTQTKGE